MKLLDSNTVIQFVNGHAGVIPRIKSPVDIAVPAVVGYEIEVGTIQSRQTGKRRRILAELFNDVEVAPFDSSAALAAAKLRCELEARGEGIGPLDTLIAGIAISRNAILVTSNTNEFKRSKAFESKTGRLEQPVIKDCVSLCDKIDDPIRNATIKACLQRTRSALKNSA